MKQTSKVVLSSALLLLLVIGRAPTVVHAQPMINGNDDIFIDPLSYCSLLDVCAELEGIGVTTMDGLGTVAGMLQWAVDNFPYELI